MKYLASVLLILSGCASTKKLVSNFGDETSRYPAQEARMLKDFPAEFKTCLVKMMVIDESPAEVRGPFFLCNPTAEGGKANFRLHEFSRPAAGNVKASMATELKSLTSLGFKTIGCTDEYTEQLDRGFKNGTVAMHGQFCTITRDENVTEPLATTLFISRQPSPTDPRAVIEKRTNVKYLSSQTNW